MAREKFRLKRAITRRRGRLLSRKEEEGFLRRLRSSPSFAMPRSLSSFSPVGVIHGEGDQAVAPNLPNIEGISLNIVGNHIGMIHGERNQTSAPNLLHIEGNPPNIVENQALTCDSRIWRDTNCTHCCPPDLFLSQPLYKALFKDKESSSNKLS